MTAKKVAAVLLLLVGCQLATADKSTTTDLLWPMPQSSQFGPRVYSLSSDTFSMTTAGVGASSSILRGALDRYLKLIFETPAPFYPSGAGSDASTTNLPGLVVDVASDDETLSSKTDESYSLTVTNGKAAINASSTYGAMRGLETFSQLVYRTQDGSYCINEVIMIKDEPRFGFRGTMIDTSRHYLSLDTILRHVDAMAYNKFNVLHWHIVDDQSFPYQSPAFPDLSAKGAYDTTHVYSQFDIAQVIDYARSRGIRVIPEFDTPGHTQSWGPGQPGLLTPCYTSGKPTGTYGPINPLPDSTWSFLQKFYTEIVNVFPDNYIHIGGDEVSFDCWKSNPDIQKWMSSKNYTDYAKLEQYYEQKLLDLVGSLNKSYVAWQEIFDNGLKIRQDTVIDVWKGGYNWKSEMANVTKAGFNAILSSCWYLNYISYGSDWPNYYNCEPFSFNGTSAQKSLVVGGEACMWAEFVDSSNFLSRFWPRGCAPGERLWSAQTVTDVDDAKIRIHNQRCRLLSRGIDAEPANGPGYCANDWTGP